VKRFIVHGTNITTRAWSVSLRLFLPTFCAVCLLIVFSGCTASSTAIVEEETVTNPKPMYNYTSLIIQDLELKREMYSDSAEAEMSPREALYAKLPQELSDSIDRNVAERNIYKKLSRVGKADASTLVLSGKFLRVGRFKISVVITLRDGASGQEVASFRQTLWDVRDTTRSISDLGRQVADFMYRIQYK
jgi:hypothetical protein